ncbi:MAG: YeeE/YedE thiosulfate transporter family protein [Acidimicrobiia bacterium]|nr:YeeE/YedE thiosulfate transporter family protein [Acidimicrobiia bacterium]
MATVTDRPTTARSLNITGLVAGSLFGGLLAGGLLHEYDTIHNTLVLEDLYVFFVMGSAIAIAAPLLWFLERRRTNTLMTGLLTLSRSKPERHHVVGGVLFGVGWALAGTCPAPALVMLSSGAWLALVAIAGIFLGLYIREVQTRVPLSPGDREQHNRPVVADFGK